MDETKCLIILNGEDRTSDILFFKHQSNKIDITFKGFKSYSYNRQNVLIEKALKVTDITSQTVLYKNEVLNNVKKMVYFKQKVKIIFKNNRCQLYDAKDIIISTNCFDNSKSKDILKYWKAIAAYAKIDQDQDSFLAREFDSLTDDVASDSILWRYMNKKPIQKLNCALDNIIFPFSFNLSQKQALENALTSNISVIEGPPGTGKTQSILNIIANLAIMQGKTVAVVSGNNAAVKNVYDKLVKEQYGFFVASLGNKDNRKAFFDNLPQYDVTGWQCNSEESVVFEKINNLNGKINYLLALNNEKAKLQQELDAYTVESKHFNIYYEAQEIEKNIKFRFYRKTPERIISFFADRQLAKTEQKVENWLYKLKLLFKYGFISFKELKKNEMSIILTLQKQYYDLKIANLNQRKNKLEKELESADFEELLEEHKKYSTILFKQKLYTKYHKLKPAGFTASDYRSNFTNFVKYFPVVLSTTHSLRNCTATGFMFDYLIIDESSQVDLLSGGLALSCCKNAIIVGDTKQLPQIVDATIQGKIQQQVSEDVYDYFKHNILSSMLALYPDVPRVVLKEHYRCHPKIIGFCNQKYYNGELIPFTKESENDAPFILYHTAAGNHMRQPKQGDNQGKFNQRELDVILDEVLQNPNVVTEKIEDIGFTTPYRNQANRAQKTFANGLECDTIHKYQGREKKLMIMSTVLDNTNAGKAGLAFVDDPCKINVAVSRAQNQFILITNNELFSHAGKEVSDLIRYIEYNTIAENLIKSEIVSVFDLLYKDYSSKLIDLKRRMPDKSEYKSENIIWQLLEDVLKEEKYNLLAFTHQILLKNLLKHTDKLSQEEVQYVNNNASVDFVVYYKLNKQPLLIIEVDGFAFHENNPTQLARDDMKNDILTKYELPYIRLSTTGSREGEQIKMKLEEVLNNNQ
ncbi:ATP-dependent RecD-like DNA helicase [bioreactor metagenome]|uniref:ATP-dependent RecD-like DNA helicase n=1 Tax=bioreactor metagenome TaxID=1076179 RepID=A0A644XIZ0_9ZZZZ